MDIEYFENRKKKITKNLPKLVTNNDSYKKFKILPKQIIVDKMLSIVLNFIKNFISR